MGSSVFGVDTGSSLIYFREGLGTKISSHPGQWLDLCVDAHV